ncbi:hypothetical protein O7632_09615 [Solwaraspora sp. WMMD406]|uniref:uridine kinase family protein n=1 Tax=Solwaraspora sp. WMMD406 TaxID=3016095 RepID=UPI002417B145|nr:hypothetical protein [Solwaraspora sp. WMMD406]MDG4764358.1 hypothetical protein [Solwaraspora sp. WMMD406]
MDERPDVVETFDGLARRVYAGPARLGPVRLVAVDGPSGAGKSTFADRLAAACAAVTPTAPVRPEPDPARPAGPATEPAGPTTTTGVAVVRTDDLLDGWTDQFTFWPRLRDQVLDPLRAGRPARYRRYDWTAGRFADTWTTLAPPAVLVLEGVSAARAAIRPTATLSVFVTAPAPVRLARSLARDGAALQPVLDRWRQAEDRFFTADGTAATVHLLVDGAAETPDGSVRCRWRGVGGDVDADGAGGAPSAG